MLLSTIAALSIGQVLSGKSIKLHQLPSDPDGTQVFQIEIREQAERLDPPHLSPKKFPDEPWEFDWLTVGYGSTRDPHQKDARVLVYSQERKQENDKALSVARMVMQIWDRAYHGYKVDAPAAIDEGRVRYHLCFGGQPGGEQAIETVPDTSGTSRVKMKKLNSIYIYRLDTFKDPIEMAREVAHEYGHAILPQIGGFKQPEVWASGYLGEKLFLKWMRNGLANGSLVPADVMGATLPTVNAWMAKNVDPLIERAATQYPDPSLINESAAGMESFNGLAMYVDALCPSTVFVRSLLYVSDEQSGRDDLKPPTEYAQDVVMAAAEVEHLTLSVPATLYDAKKPIWIPLGKGSLSGATIVTRKNGWAQVLPLMKNIIINNPPIN